MRRQALRHWKRILAMPCACERPYADGAGTELQYLVLLRSSKSCRTVSRCVPGRKSGRRVDLRHVPLDLGVSGPESGPRIVQGDTVMKYMLVMRATDEAFASMANADFNQMIETVGRFNEELIRAGVLLAGEGLADAAEGVVVDFSSEPPVVTDGPYGETKELFGGVYILNVASKEEAVEWARRQPMTGPGFKTEIRRGTTIDECPQDNEG